MKALKSWIVILIILLIIIAGGSFLFWGMLNTSAGIYVVIENQSSYKLSNGKITYLEAETIIPDIEAVKVYKTFMNLSEIRKKSVNKDKVGRIDFEYTVGKGNIKRIEVWGYIEPGDTFLYGKEVKIAVDKAGNAKVFFDFDKKEIKD
jgi:hypothetical protein